MKNGNHRHVVRRVRRRRRDPGAHGARLVDAFLEDLAVGVLLVEHELVAVLGLVELADGGVDAELAEEALHAEGARLVRDDRHDVAPDVLVPHERGEHAHEGHRGGVLAALGRGLQERLEGLELRGVEAHRAAPALRDGAAQPRARLPHVVHLRGVVRRLVIREVGEPVVLDRDREPVAELLEHLQRHLLRLVGHVLALAHGAHAVSLHRLGEDDRGLAGVIHGGVVGRVDLVRVVAAAVQAPDVLVGHVGDHRLELRVLAEEVLAHVGAVAALELLVLAVDRLFHALQEDAFLVLGEQRIPVPAPDELDHVPAGAAEVGLQLLDDLAVAANRPVEALQVAVHDEHEVVEPFAGRHADGAHRLGLVHLAVAHEGPHLAPLGVGKRAILDVAQEARLVDGLDRPQAHRHRRELPEIGHEPGVRVGGDPLAVDLLAEHVQLRLGEAPLEEGARIDARRGVALDVDQVPAVVLRGRMPEMVEAHVVERGRGGEARDVAAELQVLPAGPQHHRHRVPAHDVAQPILDLHVAGDRRLEMRRNGVDVRGGGAVGQVHPRVPRLVDEVLEEEVRALGAFDGENGFQRVDPFSGFQRVDVLRAVHGGLGGLGVREGGAARKGSIRPNRIIAGNLAAAAGGAAPGPPDGGYAKAAGREGAWPRKVPRQIRHIGPTIGTVSQKNILSYYKNGFLHFSSGRPDGPSAGSAARRTALAAVPVTGNHKNRERNGPSGAPNRGERSAQRKPGGCARARPFRLPSE